MQCSNRCHLAMIAFINCQEAIVVRWHLLVCWMRRKQLKQFSIYVFRIAFTASPFCEALSCLRKRPSCQHIGKNFLKLHYYTTISLWSPTNSGAKISVIYIRFGTCENKPTLFLIVFQQSGLSQKIAKNVSFCFKSVLKHELWQIKSHYFAIVLVFLKCDMPRWALPCFR